MNSKEENDMRDAENELYNKEFLRRNKSAFPSESGKKTNPTETPKRLGHDWPPKHLILTMDEVGMEPETNEGFPGMERIADCDPEWPMTVAIIADAVWCGLVCKEIPPSRMIDAERIGQITVGYGETIQHDHETFIAYGPEGNIRKMHAFINEPLEKGEFEGDDLWSCWKEAARAAA